MIEEGSGWMSVQPGRKYAPTDSVRHAPKERDTLQWAQRVSLRIVLAMEAYRSVL